MARLKLTVEYDGRPFSGWQAQPQGNTIQQALEGSLFTYLRSEGKKRNITLSETIDITASGRTDAGVSARGQVCHFDLPQGLELDQGMLQQSLNGILDKSVKVRDIEIVDSSFHSRHSPHSKVYSYRMSMTDYPRAFEPELSYPIGKGVNLGRMIDAATVSYTHLTLPTKRIV